MGGWHGVTGWHGWDWQGWSALVALGTLALAGVTFGLVRMTRGLVTATAALAVQTQADVEAQWVPILVGTPSGEGFPNPSVRLEGGDIHIALRNVGRGPVVNIGARIGGSPRNNDWHTIAPGEWSWLTVDHTKYTSTLDPDETVWDLDLRVVYADVSRQKVYATHAWLKAYPRDGRVERGTIAYEGPPEFWT